MTYTVLPTFEEGIEEMRTVYCNTLMDLAKDDNRIVAMDADLVNSIGMLPFQKQYPEKMINCGIQEANMIGVASGMSVLGKIPFVHTFGCFATRRAYDQVFISGAYNKSNIRIIGSDPGVTAAFNGGTHMPLEDLGIMRNIPTMVIIEPTDGVMLENILRKSIDYQGVMYIRLSRKKPISIFKEGSQFEIGKAATLREGSDVTIICSGIEVYESLVAAEELQKIGISAEVINMFTIKPIDKEAIISSAKKTGAIVTAENHNIINGLGSAVCEVVAESIPVPVERIGVQDEFGEVGSVDYLKKKFKLTADDIVKACKRSIARKGGR